MRRKLYLLYLLLPVTSVAQSPYGPPWRHAVANGMALNSTSVSTYQVIDPFPNLVGAGSISFEDAVAHSAAISNSLQTLDMHERMPMPHKAALDPSGMDRLYGGGPIMQTHYGSSVSPNISEMIRNLTSCNGTTHQKSQKRQGNTRVMIVGDSMTQGQQGDVTWRYHMWTWFRDQGLSVDFVGPYTGTLAPPAPNPGPQLTPPRLYDAGTPPTIDILNVDGTYALSNEAGWDSDHFSVWGRAAAVDKGLIQGILSAHPADLMLVMLGFNDLGWFYSDTYGTLDSIHDLITNSRNANPSIQIALANIPERSFIGGRQDLVDNTRLYNQLLPSYIAQWSTDQSPIHLVHLEETYNCHPSSCPVGYDGLHPNELGEFQIANAFTTTLVNDFHIGNSPIAVPSAPPARDLPMPTNFRVFSSPQGVSATWDPVYGAYSYTVRSSLGEGIWDFSPGSVMNNRWDSHWALEGFHYTLSVAAAAGDRVSDFTATLEADAQPETAPPPVNINVQPTADGFTISWDPPSGLYSDDITEYNIIYWDHDPESCFFISGAAFLSSPGTVRGLIPGHRILVAPESWNARAGEGFPHIANDVIPGGGEPGVPTGLQVIATDPASVYGTFDEVPGAAGYALWIRDTADPNSVSTRQNLTLPTACFVDYYLFPGAQYYEFCVSAFNGNLESGKSNCVRPAQPSGSTPHRSCPPPPGWCTNPQSGGGGGGVSSSAGGGGQTTQTLAPGGSTTIFGGTTFTAPGGSTTVIGGTTVVGGTTSILPDGATIIVGGSTIGGATVIGGTTSILPDGETTVFGGSTIGGATVIGGTTSILPDGETTVIGGTTIGGATVIGGTTSILPDGETTVIGGSTIGGATVVGGTTSILPDGQTTVIGGSTVGGSGQSTLITTTLPNGQPTTILLTPTAQTTTSSPVIAGGILSPITTPVPEPKATDGGTDIPCNLWFFFICISWGELHIQGWEIDLPPGTYPPGPPPRITIDPALSITLSVSGTLPDWPSLTIGPDHLPTYPPKPSNGPDDGCETESAELCATSTSYGVSLSRGSTITTASEAVSTCATIYGCSVEDSSTTNTVTTGCTSARTVTDYFVSCTTTAPGASSCTTTSSTTATGCSVTPTTVTCGILTPTGIAPDPACSADVFTYVVWPMDGTNSDQVSAIQSELQSYLRDPSDLHTSTANGIGTNYWTMPLTRDQSYEVANITNVASVNDYCGVSCTYDPTEAFNYQRLGVPSDDPSWAMEHLSFISWPRGQETNPHRREYFFDSSLGSGIPVYIVDTGATMSHPDFTRLQNVRWLPNDAPQSDSGYRGHGTAMLSLVAGLEAGVAKNIQPILVRMQSQTYTTTEWIDGLTAINDELTSQSDSSKVVILMATYFGRDYFTMNALQGMAGLESRGFETAAYFLLESLVSKGAILVTGSGNTQFYGELSDGWPANFGKTNNLYYLPSLMVVGGVDNAGGNPYGRTDPANGIPQFYAPGRQVNVAVHDIQAWGNPPNPRNQFRYFTGTSAAAALTAGLSAYFLRLIQLDLLTDHNRNPVANNPQAMKDFISSPDDVVWSRTTSNNPLGIWNKADLSRSACPWDPNSRAAKLFRRQEAPSCRVPGTTATTAPTPTVTSPAPTTSTIGPSLSAPPGSTCVSIYSCANTSPEDGDGLCHCQFGTASSTTVFTQSGGPGNPCPATTCSATPTPTSTLPPPPSWNISRYASSDCSGPVDLFSSGVGAGCEAVNSPTDGIHSWVYAGDNPSVLEYTDGSCQNEVVGSNGLGTPIDSGHCNSRVYPSNWLLISLMGSPP